MISNAKVIEKCRRFKEIQALEEQLKKEKEQLKKELMNEMKNRGKKELLLDVYKIIYIFTEGTNKFDTKRFEKEHKKMYEAYLTAKSADSEKLLVNVGN